MTLELDLALWEAGRLDLAELEARYPDAGVGSIVSVHEQLAAVAAEPVGSGDERWVALRDRLPDRAQPISIPERAASGVWGRTGRFVRRPLIAAVAVVALSGAAAFAASPAVRTQVGHAVHRITHLFAPPDQPSPRPFVPSASPTAITDSPSPSDQTGDQTGSGGNGNDQSGQGSGDGGGTGTDQGGSNGGGGGSSGGSGDTGTSGDSGSSSGSGGVPGTSGDTASSGGSQESGSIPSGDGSSGSGSGGSGNQ